MHRLHFAEVDNHIEVFEQSLPFVVLIGPAAEYAVSESGGAMRRPLLAERLVVGHLAALGEMVDRLKAFATIAILVGEVEGVIAQLLQKSAEGYGTRAELGVILILVAAPTCFSHGESAGVIHIFGMFGSGHIFGPEVALHAQ